MNSAPYGPFRPLLGGVVKEKMRRGLPRRPLHDQLFVKLLYIGSQGGITVGSVEKSFKTSGETYFLLITTAWMKRSNQSSVIV